MRPRAMPLADQSLPSAADLAAREEAYRRNPRSDAAVGLADAYCALGRYAEAADLCQKGLLHMPDSVGTRLALGRAYVGLQQWREAQTELLKVVKLDRSSVEGFRLLGEALMRRSDFERALPILQHAQNLAPADARVLQMLKRAREGRALDPPTAAAPVAAPPVVPVAAAAPPAAAPRAAARPKPGHDFEAQMTKVAADDYGGHLDQGSDAGFPDEAAARTQVRGSAGRPAPAPSQSDDDNLPTRVGFDAGQPSAGRGDATVPHMELGEDVGTVRRAMPAAAPARPAPPAPPAPAARKPPAPPASPAPAAARPASPPIPPARPQPPAAPPRPLAPAAAPPPAPAPAAPAAAPRAAAQVAKIPLKKPDAPPAAPSRTAPRGVQRIESADLDESSAAPAAHAAAPSLVVDVDADLGGSDQGETVAARSAARKEPPRKPARPEPAPSEDVSFGDADDPASAALAASLGAPAPARPAKPARPAARPAGPESDAGGDGDAEAPARGPTKKAAPREAQAPGATVMVAQAMQRAGANHEDFLNTLLGAGLVSVPGVQARSDDELKLAELGPGKRWGRSITGAMIFIWVLVAGLGAGGYFGWRYWKQLQYKAVTRYLADANTKLETGGHGSIQGSGGALDLVRKAIKKETSLRTLAASALVQGILLRDYGEGNDNTFALLVGQLKKKVESRKLPLTRPEALAARIAESAQLSRRRDTAGAVKLMTEAVAAHPRDIQALTALAMAEVAAGDRVSARSHAETATQLSPRAATALSLLGDIELDDGDYKSALAHYDAALAIDPRHPLALLGRGLLRIEHARELDKVMADVNTGLSQAQTPRIDMWKHLALGEYYLYREEDETLADKELDAAEKGAITDTRYLLRLGLARLWEGRLERAAHARDSAVQLGGEGWLKHPLILTIDAELQLARDQPAEAAKLVGQSGQAAPRLLYARARTMLRLDQPGDAMAVLQTLIEESPDDALGKAYLELARGLSTKDKLERESARESLKKLSLASKTGLPRALLGELLLSLNDPGAARRELEQGLTQNPEVYRTRVLLSRAYAAEGQKDKAQAALEEAVKENPAFLSATSELGKLLVSVGRQAEAIPLLERVREQGKAGWREELALAEAYAPTDPVRAKEALDRAATMPGVSEGELERVSDVVTPKDAPAPPRRRGKGR